MALGGRQLNPLIYGSIVQALGGISPAGFGNPDGGPFSTGIPGQSGYATSFFSPNFGLPLVLLAGVDTNESHMAQETIDYGDPTITASQVVDRRTLKAFVNESAAFFEELLASEDAAASSKVRIAFRDENGPWKHGLVYLFIMDRTGYTIFHGADPDRFELQIPTQTLRDVVTGELILPQIIDVATGSSGGGFVEYHFDNPADPNDNADTPKVTYAREIYGEFARPDGIVTPIHFIIGAGIYGDPVPEESTVAAKDWLSRFGRTVGGQAVDMIGNRLAAQSSGESRVKIEGRTLNLDDLRSFEGRRPAPPSLSTGTMTEELSGA